MLVVRIELWPGGSEVGKRLLAEARIANLGRGRRGYSYRAQVVEEGDRELGIEPLQRTVEVQAHNRRQSAWRLVARVLRQLQKDIGSGHGGDAAEASSAAQHGAPAGTRDRAGAPSSEWRWIKARDPSQGG